MQPAGDLASLAGEGSLFAGAAMEKLERLQAELQPLSERYDVVVANPPYMGSSSLGKWMGAWVKKHYPEAYRDLCTSFIGRGFTLSDDQGYSAMVTMQSWMFLGSYEKLRDVILRNHSISSMAHLGTRAFGAIGGEVVSTTATVFANAKYEARGSYFRLVDMGSEEEKQAGLLEALADPNCPWRYQSLADDFDALPGSPISYWASKSIRQSFKTMKTVGDFSKPHIGMQTGDNERFLRFWWEASFDHIFMDCDSEEESFASPKKWYPCNKGGSFRRWYGNQDYVVDWQNDGRVIVGDAEKEKRKFMNLPPEYKFKPNVAWSMLSSSCAAFRYFPAGFIFEHAASGMVGDETILMSILGFCNSEVAKAMLALVSPTLNFNVSSIAQLPMNPEKNDVVAEIARENVTLTKSDWDSFEESWNFEKHPLV